MAYMNKNVNLGLLMLLGIVLLGMAGLSTYYQKNFYNVSLSFEEKAAELKAVTDTLMLEKSRLNETSYQLTIKKSREKDLSKISEELAVEKSNLEQDKQMLQTELAKSNKELISSNQELAKARIDLDEKEAAIERKDAQIQEFQSRVSSYKNKLDEACNAITGTKPAAC